MLRVSFQVHLSTYTSFYIISLYTLLYMNMRSYTDTSRHLFGVRGVLCIPRIRSVVEHTLHQRRFRYDIWLSQSLF